MSMLLMVQAMQAKIGNPIRKLVLIKLADNANDQGECFPSYQHIADHCEVDKRTVIRHVKALRDAGYLSITHRKGVKGNSSNIFKLSIPSDPLSPPSDRVSLPPSDPVSPRTSHSIEPVNEPKRDFVKNDIDEGFNFFWDCYPNKQGKTAAYKKFSKITSKLKTKQELIDFVNNLANDVTLRYANTEKQYVPHGSTYMNGERWNDELQQ